MSKSGASALNDDANLLMDMNKLCGDRRNDKEVLSLYQEGFNAEYFVAVVEDSKVWEPILERA